MKLTENQKQALVDHVYQLHIQGEIDWRRTMFRTSFQANLSTGATLFCSLYIDESDGKLTSMPLNVTHGSKSVNLPPHDKKLLIIGQHLAEKWLQSPQEEPEEFLDAVVGVSARREKRINQVMGGTTRKEEPEEKKATIMERLKNIFG